MSVLFVAYDDYANLQHSMANSLRSIGVECMDVKLVPHQFGYATQSIVVNRENLIELVPMHDVVVFFHTTHSIYEFIKPYVRGRLAAFHSGTTYRNNPALCNGIYNADCYLTLTDQPEFMELGAKNIHYVAAPIDTTKIFPVNKPVKRPYVIGHFPSKPEVKGTHKIIEMLEPFKNDFDIRIDQRLVSHSDNLKRMAECDIYIELFKNELHGKPYGQFGVTAMEAAALGKAVVTQNLFGDAYIDAYSYVPAFQYPESKHAFEKIITWLNDMEPKELMYEQKATRDWLVKHHSYKATGERLKLLLDL